MESTESAFQEGGDHTMRVRVENVPNYQCQLRLSSKASGSAHMTVLLFIIDLVKERVGISKMENKETQVCFDEENLTTHEEILQTRMEDVLIRRVGPENPFNDKLQVALEDTDMVYLNDKEQLIKVVKVTKPSGREVDVHNILTFDVNKLPQATKHSYKGDEQMAFGAGLARAKVPVKDGKSQNKFIQDNKKKGRLVENPDSVLYTAAEVAEHNTEDDCWTIYKGRIYDVTEYAAVHPGGRKIFLGKGKDCTTLFDQYHPWVNCPALIGKYQVGVLKQG